MKRIKKRTIPRWKKLLAAALAAAAISGGAIAGNLPYFQGEKVIEVIDGDTFFITNHQRIRLYGVNAPELSYCMGNDAKKALSSLILGKRIFIRTPVADRYGRIMALVYQKKTLINEVMLRSGMAQYDGAGKSGREQLYRADIYARNNKIGIYSSTCTQTNPPNPSCTIKGNVDITTDRKNYFLPKCAYYPAVIIHKFEGDDWFCTEAEAKKAGFVKSNTCK
jgi:endonuclease YncB( thermonuclease family)